jgi:hypothetical protein
VLFARAKVARVIDPRLFPENLGPYLAFGLCQSVIGHQALEFTDIEKYLTTSQLMCAHKTPSGSNFANPGTDSAGNMGSPSSPNSPKKPNGPSGSRVIHRLTIRCVGVFAALVVYSISSHRHHPRC